MKRENSTQVRKMSWLPLPYRLKLCVLASEIIWRTYFFAAGGLVLTNIMKACLATRIAIVISDLEDSEKNTSIDWLRNWRELIVYPCPFKPHRQSDVSLGGSPLHFIMHTDRVELGETSEECALILSWLNANPRDLYRMPAQVLNHEPANIAIKELRWLLLFGRRLILLQTVSIASIATSK